MNLMVVGGEFHTVEGSYSDRLAEHGAYITHHINEAKRLRSIPSEVDMVLILADSVDHQLANKAVDLAKKSDTPFTYASRKAAVALQTLRSRGLCTPLAELEEEETSTGSLMDYAVDYVCTELQRTGRLSSREEITRELDKVSRSFCVSPDFFDEVQSRAQALVPSFPGAQKNSVPVQDVQEWTTTIVQDDPRLVLFPEEVVKKVQDFLDGEFPEGGDQIVRDTVAQTRHVWLNPMRFSGGKQKREAAMRRWLYLLADKSLKTGEKFPSARQLRSLSKEIFHIEPRPYSMIKEERQAAARDHGLDYDPFSPGKDPLPGLEKEPPKTEDGPTVNEVELLVAREVQKAVDSLHQKAQERSEKAAQKAEKAIDRLVQDAQKVGDRLLHQVEERSQVLAQRETRVSSKLSKIEELSEEIDEKLSDYLDVAEAMVKEQLTLVLGCGEEPHLAEEGAKDVPDQHPDNPFFAFLDEARERGVKVEITVRMAT